MKKICITTCILYFDYPNRIKLFFRVAVAKPAPPDSQLKPIDYTSATGARFDVYGNIIPHSILGSVEEFKKQALEHGDLPPVSQLSLEYLFMT